MINRKEITKGEKSCKERLCIWSWYNKMS